MWEAKRTWRLNEPIGALAHLQLGRAYAFEGDAAKARAAYQDLRAGELRKQGKRIKHQEQSFRVLTVLLQRPGEVVTREELRNQNWPPESKQGAAMQLGSKPIPANLAFQPVLVSFIWLSDNTNPLSKSIGKPFVFSRMTLWRTDLWPTAICY